MTGVDCNYDSKGIKPYIGFVNKRTIEIEEWRGWRKVKKFEKTRKKRTFFEKFEYQPTAATAAKVRDWRTKESTGRVGRTVEAERCLIFYATC